MTPDFDDPLTVYLDEVRKVPPLNRAEELDCIGHVRSRDAMAEVSGRRLVEANLGLVVRMAERQENYRFRLLDLIEKGNDGLLRAVEALGESETIDFSAHAKPFVERALARAVSDQR